MNRHRAGTRTLELGCPSPSAGASPWEPVQSLPRRLWASAVVNIITKVACHSHGPLFSSGRTWAPPSSPLTATGFTPTPRPLQSLLCSRSRTVVENWDQNRPLPLLHLHFHGDK